MENFPLSTPSLVSLALRRYSLVVSITNSIHWCMCVCSYVDCGWVLCSLSISRSVCSPHSFVLPARTHTHAHWKLFRLLLLNWTVKIILENWLHLLLGGTVLIATAINIDEIQTGIDNLQFSKARIQIGFSSLLFLLLLSSFNLYCAFGINKNVNRNRFNSMESIVAAADVAVIFSKWPNEKNGS